MLCNTHTRKSGIRIMNTLIKCNFVLLVLIFIYSCKTNNTNPLSGKRFAADVQGEQVEAFEFIDNESFILYSAFYDDQVGKYTFDKNTNIIKITFNDTNKTNYKKNTDLHYNPNTKSLSFTTEGHIFNCIPVEKINIDFSFGLSQKMSKHTTKNLSWFTDLKELRFKTKGENPAEAFIVIALGYEKNSDTLNILTQKKDIIDSLLLKYFSQKTSEELDVLSENELLIQLKEIINKEIIEKAANAKVQDIVFAAKDIESL
ncbi:MAG: hypothetical protein K6F69_07635 [Treponema sp.]|nr:hypothetical protein [Treponema sp.]